MSESTSTTHLTWQLQAFDHSGNVIGSIIKTREGPPTLHGTPEAFACCIPDLQHLPHFFTDPDHIARELYEEYINQYPFPSPLSWEALKSHRPVIADRWRAIASAARRAKPFAN